MGLSPVVRVKTLLASDSERCAVRTPAPALRQRPHIALFNQARGQPREKPRLEIEAEVPRGAVAALRLFRAGGVRDPRVDEKKAAFARFELFLPHPEKDASLLHDADLQLLVPVPARTAEGQHPELPAAKGERKVRPAVLGGLAAAFNPQRKGRGHDRHCELRGFHHGGDPAQPHPRGRHALHPHPLLHGRQADRGGLGAGDFNGHPLSLNARLARPRRGSRERSFRGFRAQVPGGGLSLLSGREGFPRRRQRPGRGATARRVSCGPGATASSPTRSIPRRPSFSSLSCPPSSRPGRNRAPFLFCCSDSRFSRRARFGT